MECRICKWHSEKVQFGKWLLCAVLGRYKAALLLKSSSHLIASSVNMNPKDMSQKTLKGRELSQENHRRIFRLLDPSEFR